VKEAVKSLEFNPKDIGIMLESGKDDSGLFSLASLGVHDEKSVKGRFDIFNYKNIAYVGIKDLQISKSFTATNHLEDMISIDILLEGGSDLQLGAKYILNNDMPKIVLSSHHINGIQSRLHKAGENYKGVGIWISPRYLQQLFHLNYAEFGGTVSDILQANINHSLIYPVTNEVRKVIKDIIDNPYKSKVKHLYIEAKVAELLCIIMRCVVSPELTFNQDNQLTAAKASAMRHVLSIVDKNLNAVPRLDEISALIGMSKGQLGKTFKLSYGMSLTDYISQKRLMKAKELVNEGKMSVLQIALEVGYTNQSSFGRAYKKHYGYPPLKSINLKTT
jgi:AraC-like DNA-binding protein